MDAIQSVIDDFKETGEILGMDVLEVGSCDEFQRLRKGIMSLSPKSYTGLDFQGTIGVDVICPAEKMMDKFQPESFDNERCKMFNLSLYNDDFFEWHKKYADEFSIKTGIKLFEYYKPKSVIDWGCGIGSYLLAAKRCGVELLKGLDIGGDFAKKYTSEDVVGYIACGDITKKMVLDQFDVALCIEVAEHIEPTGSKQLVENVCSNVKNLVVFTAAPEGQIGTGHINCKPKQYWIDLFLENDCVYSVSETKIVLKLWEEAEWYIKQNLMVFEKRKIV